MTNPLNLQTHSTAAPGTPLEVDYENYVWAPPAFLHEFELGDGILAPRHPACVRLDLQDLQSFESVDTQYQAYGVTFHNAIAIQPSNPAFPSRNGAMVMMAAPKSGMIEAIFLKPVSLVNGFITGSRRTILSAFDDHDRKIAENGTTGANLAHLNGGAIANACLSVACLGIRRVQFHCFDGNLTLSELSFSY
jgi:hypothetical protein